jgi:hypothetical protein
VRRWIGKELEFIPDTGKKPGLITGLTENYLKVFIRRPRAGDGPGFPRGGLFRCVLLREAGGVHEGDKRFDAEAELVL